MQARIALVLGNAPRFSRRVLPFAAMALVVALSAGPVLAQANGTWTATASGTWGTATNWQSNIVGTGTGFTATFGPDIASDVTVTNNAQRAVGAIVFGTAASPSGTGAWIVTGSNVVMNMGNSTLPSTITVNSLGSVTISSVVQSGTANLSLVVKDGAGKLILTNTANAINTKVSIAGGTLEVNNERVLGALPGSYSADQLQISNNATFRTTATATISANRGITIGSGGGTISVNGGALALATRVSGAGNTVTVTGASPLTLTASAVGTNVDWDFSSNNGIRTFFEGANALGTGSVRVRSGVRLVSQSRSSGTLNNAVTMDSGAGLTARSSGGALTYANVTLPVSGTIVLNKDDQTTSRLAILSGGTLTGTLTVDTSQGGTNSVGDVTLSGVFSGAGGLVKAGTGTSGRLILAGANTYSGTTRVATGTLVVNGDQSLATGPVILASGATLAGTGTVGGVTAIESGATVSPGASPGTLSFTQGVTLGSGGSYNWQMYDAGGTAGASNGWDLLSVGGVLDVAATSGSTFNLNLWSLSGIGPDVSGPAVNFSPAVSGTWRIASAAGGITNFDSGKFAINVSATNGTGGFTNPLAGGAFSLVQTGNDLNLVFTTIVPPTLTWYGDGVSAGGGGTWSTSGTTWYDGSVVREWEPWSKAVFGGTTAGTVTLDAGVSARSGLEFVTSGYTLAGSGLTLAGTANSISVAAAATATISAPLAGTAGFSKTGAGTLILAGTSTYAGTTTVSAGTLVVDGAITGTSPVTLVAGATLAGSGSIGGSVSVGSSTTLSPGSSPGTLTIGGSVTLASGGNYNWQVYDAGGTAGGSTGWDLLSVGGVLDVAATSGTTFNLNLWSLSGIGPDVNGNALNFNPLSSGTWRIASAAGGITNFAADKFTINVSSANGTGGFTNGLSGGTFSLAQVGNDLNLVFTSGSATPTPTTLTWYGDGVGAGGGGTWTTSGNTWFDGTTVRTWVPAAQAVFSGSAGTVTLGEPVSVDGGLQFASSGYTLSGAGLTIGGTVNSVEVAGAATATINSALSGTIGMVKTGSGTLVLGGANTLSGATLVQTGTLQVASGGSLASSPVTVPSGGALKVDSGVTLQSPSVTLSGGRLDAAGTTLVVSGTGGGIGQLVVTGGTIAGVPGLSVSGSGQMTLPAGSRQVVNVTSLAVDQATGGKIDIGKGRINVAVGGITEADLRADLVAGRSGGTWSGTSGIVTTGGTAGLSTQPVVGYRVFTTGSAIVAWAAFGDANLDGQVNLTDVSLINNGGKFGQGPSTNSTWVQGDFNYSNGVTLTDIQLLNNSGLYNAGSYLPAVGLGSLGGSLGDGGAVPMLASVPEPGTWALALMGLAGAMGVIRRGRSRPS